MGFTCYCINLCTIANASFLRITMGSLFTQVSAFAKIMEHGITVDQFEEEKIA